MSRDIISEQQNNIEFVKIVEKYPSLYNYELPSYSRKDLSDKAWEEVGKATNMTPSACRERWRNLRAVFVRTMKKTRSGNKKKPYYLAEAMQFVVPFMRPLFNAEKPEKTMHTNNETPGRDSDESLLVEIEPFKAEQLREEEDIMSDIMHEENMQTRKRPLHEVEEIHYTKKIPPVQDTPSMIPAESDAVKSFLNSLLPELNEMNSAQFKAFKRRVLTLIDDITGEIPTTSKHQDDEYIM